MAEVFVEISEEMLDEVSGGSTASFSFSNTASGTTANVIATFSQATTASSASQSGSFSSSST